MKNNFEQRKEARIAYAQKQAAKNKQLSKDLADRAFKMSQAIPMGQPILVGHHSEKSDRRYREQIHNTFGKSVAADNKAGYYEQKAETIENNTAIFSDDPQAIEKLTAQLEQLQKLQAFMKTANSCIRKKDKDTFLKMEWATESLWVELNTPDYLRRVGFSSYRLNNNNASIARIRKRIEQLQKVATKTTQETAVAAGIRLIENAEANRVQLVFDEKPSEEVRTLLKQYAFRWSPSEKAWQRHLNINGIIAAKHFFQKLNQKSI